MTGTDISFGDNYNTVGDAITHDSPSTDFKITEDGLYRVTYYVYFFSQTGTASFQIHNYGSSLDSVNVTDSRTPMEAIKSTVLPLPAGAVLTLEFLGMLNGDVDAVEVYYSSIKIEKIGNL
ncbi:MAG: hypothetical protein LBN25_02245, partial [Christensenellaceae bacterium]|jgi:hypothetical protein|nr:hypothetical protein [Christensenellaceae bacterium]